MYHESSLTFHPFPLPALPPPAACYHPFLCLGFLHLNFLGIDQHHLDEHMAVNDRQPGTGLDAGHISRYRVKGRQGFPYLHL